MPVTVIERKKPKFVRATVSANKVTPNTTPKASPVMKTKRPSFKAPTEPPSPSARNQFMLTKSETTSILNLLKKFSNANKQLLAVSRTTAERLKTLQSSKVEFMTAQLQLAREELSAANTKYTEAVRDALSKPDHVNTIKVVHLTSDVANYTSLICAGMKSVAMEFKADDSCFLPVLTSLLTARDSLTSLLEILETTKEKIDKSISVELTGYVKNLAALTNTLLACKSGKLIPFGRKLELEAAARAATCSIVKLVNSFGRPIEQSIVYETKVASSCISQLWATLNELSSSPNMLSFKKAKLILTDFLSDLKVNLAEFMESTKQQVSNPSPDVLQVMKSHAQPIRELLFNIVANINLFAEIDTSTITENEINLTVTETHKKRASLVTGDPEDLVPPPPSTTQAQSIDIPDDAVPDINPIWYEPNNDDGRILYTETKTIKCATLNKLLIHLTDNLGKNLHE